MSWRTSSIHLARRLQKFATVFSIPAIVLFLVAGSVAWAVNDPGLYRNGFQRYDVAVRSGITDADLLIIGAELRRYFNTGAEPLEVRASIFGVEQHVFNRREIAHMYDVKRLVRGVYWVAVGSAFWILATLASGFLTSRGAWLRSAAHIVAWGATATLVAVFAVGLAAIANFERLFLLFHQLSFANDLWMLNPRTDYLLILFPAGFWFDATMRVALTSVLGALLLMSAGGSVLLFLRWKSYRPATLRQPSGSPVPGPD